MQDYISMYRLFLLKMPGILLLATNGTKPHDTGFQTRSINAKIKCPDRAGAFSKNINPQNGKSLQNSRTTRHASQNIATTRHQPLLQNLTNRTYSQVFTSIQEKTSYPKGKKVEPFSVFPSTTRLKRQEANHEKVLPFSTKYRISVYQHFT